MCRVGRRKVSQAKAEFYGAVHPLFNSERRREEGRGGKKERMAERMISVIMVV